jgi:hypothetical protein
LTTDKTLVTLSAEDRLDIIELTARFDWAVDTDDWDEFERLWLPDAEFVTPGGSYRGAEGLAEFTSVFRKLGPGARQKGFAARSRYHLPINFVFERGGDPDTVRYVAQFMGPRIREDGAAAFASGWYDDLVRRTPAGWRFARRVFTAWDEGRPQGSPIPLP